MVRLPRRPRLANHARVSSRNCTIDDVAKAAGVARVTVSRVLNNGQNVRPETRERVRRAVEALGYSVNPQARALASGSSRQVMLIHIHNPEREPNSYYHAGLELGALRACSSLGFDLVTRAIDPVGENPADLLSSILEHERPVGIVVSPPLSDDVSLLTSIRRAGVRIVAISAGELGRTAAHAVGNRRTQRGPGDRRTSGFAGAPSPGISEGTARASRSGAAVRRIRRRVAQCRS